MIDPASVPSSTVDWTGAHRIVRSLHPPIDFFALARLEGERWRVGSALLEVTGPRIPCATFAAWMGERGWVRRFTARGRTGAYLAVVEPGVVSAGDAVEVLDRPAHGITVPEVFRAFTGDDGAAARVLAARVLAPDDHAALERRLARRAVAPPG